MKKTSRPKHVARYSSDRRPPEPTAADPFAQVRWAFERRARVPTVDSDDGRANYRYACSFLIKHLIATRGSEPYYIAKEWGEFTLLELRDSILERRDAGEIRAGSHHLVNTFSAMRGAFETAAKLGALNTRTVLRVTVTAPQPETDMHSAYTDAELKQVVHALETELAFCDAVSRPPMMMADSLGTDPRTGPNSKTSGFGLESNMRWYFVHVLACKPVLSFGEDKVIHQQFLRAAQTWYGGLHTLYRSWNVSAFVDLDVMMPLVTWLNYVTGLNPSTVYSMEVDSYQDSHALTGAPYLKLVKPRSGGDIELHLPLLDGTPTLPLKGKQSVWVRRIVDLALKLTKPLRDRLPDNHPLKSKLFLFESTAPAYWREVKVLSSDVAVTWRKRMSAKYNLRKEDGSPMSFNNVRFRSTLLTRMVLAGRDLLDVKSVAAHAELGTTFRYMAVRQLFAEARRAVGKALERIRKNRKKFPELAAPKPDRKTRPAAKVIPIRLYKGLVSDCLDVFDPPESVRRTTNYVEGKACNRFNMCLFCHNIIIFKRHLPKLAAYRKQIRSSDTEDVPNASFYSATLDVLDNLFDPNFGEFSREDIDWAEEQSKYVNVAVDSLVFKAVLQ
jgi:hypothetical protein